MVDKTQGFDPYLTQLNGCEFMDDDPATLTQLGRFVDQALLGIGGEEQSQEQPLEPLCSSDLSQKSLRNPLGSETTVFRRLQTLPQSGPAGGTNDPEAVEEMSNEVYVPDQEYRRLLGITATAYQQILTGKDASGAMKAIQQIQHPQSFVPMSKAK